MINIKGYVAEIVASNDPRGTLISFYKALFKDYRGVDINYNFISNSLFSKLEYKSKLPMIF